jgi:hypothetical protein
MKFKKLLISVALATTALTASADIGSAVIGIVIGSALVAHKPPQVVYVQPQFGYVQPQIRYETPPVIITPSQAPYYDPNLHGYCAAYRDELYAECIGNAQRRKLEEAYNRGLYGR